MESTPLWVVRQMHVTIRREVYRHLLHNTVHTMQISPTVQGILYGKTKKGNAVYIPNFLVNPDIAHPFGSFAKRRPNIICQVWPLIGLYRDQTET